MTANKIYSTKSILFDSMAVGLVALLLFFYMGDGLESLVVFVVGFFATIIRL